MKESVSKSRIKNAKRNVASGLIKQFVGIGLTFAIRTAIIYTLGAEYQGLSGLFTAILQVLNLTDLGFSTAVTFVLYEPIAEEDTDRICSIIAFLKKVYFVIGLVILGIGLVLMPFLPQLISGDCPDDINLYTIFAIYLFNTVISYLLFAYKSTLLTAMQRDDVVSKIYTLSSLLIKLLQLILLFVFRNYYVYIFILPVGTVINNVLLQYFSKKIFPNLIPRGKISIANKSELSKQIKAVFVNRLSDIARNCFDDIIVSSFIGLVAVAVYDNYFYVYTAVIGIMSIIIHSIQASIGNSLVKESVEKNYNDLKKFTFIFMFIAGWCTVCMFCLYQPFMYIWMRGKSEMMLPFFEMALFCLYFYSFCMTYTKGVYLEGKGLFWECRSLYIAEAFGNLFLNIVLGYFWGIKGVLIATIVTIFCINFIGGSNVLFKYYFVDGKKEFFALHLLCFLTTIVNCIICYYVTNMIPGIGVLSLLLRLIVCGILPPIIYLLCYHRLRIFGEAVSIGKRFIKK